MQITQSAHLLASSWIPISGCNRQKGKPKSLRRSDLALNSFVCQCHPDNDLLSGSDFHLECQQRQEGRKWYAGRIAAPELLTALIERPFENSLLFSLSQSRVQEVNHSKVEVIYISAYPFRWSTLSPNFVSVWFWLLHSLAFYRKRLLVLRIIHGPNGMGYFGFSLDELFTLLSELQFRRSEEQCEDIPPPSPCWTSLIDLSLTVQVLNPSTRLSKLWIELHACFIKVLNK